MAFGPPHCSVSCCLSSRYFLSDFPLRHHQCIIRFLLKLLLQPGWSCKLGEISWLPTIIIVTCYCWCQQRLLRSIIMVNANALCNNVINNYCYGGEIAVLLRTIGKLSCFPSCKVCVTFLGDLLVQYYTVCTVGGSSFRPSCLNSRYIKRHHQTGLLRHLDIYIRQLPILGPSAFTQI